MARAGAGATAAAERGAALRGGGAASPATWLAVALALALGTTLAAIAPAAALDWQPALAWREPWRAWTAAFVHYSALHLAANAAGLMLVAALGVAARVPRQAALAWFLAWPLTQFGLLVQPALLHYGGLSGVLHAGVAVAALHLAWRGRRGERWIGAALLGGLVLKVISEAPWGAPLRHPAGWDIAVAPAAHACGLAAGLLCGMGVWGWSGWRRRARGG